MNESRKIPRHSSATEKDAKPPQSRIVTGRRTDPVKLSVAREFRKYPTEAEARAWGLLRRRNMLGLKFRRQQVIAGFIADCYCAEERLVVEIDGEVHDAQQEYDHARSEVFRTLGIRVVRIRNDEVSEEGLKRALRRWVVAAAMAACQCERLVTSPPGPLSLAGEGEGAS